MIDGMEVEIVVDCTRITLERDRAAKNCNCQLSHALTTATIGTSTLSSLSTIVPLARIFLDIYGTHVQLYNTLSMFLFLICHTYLSQSTTRENPPPKPERWKSQALLSFSTLYPHGLATRAAGVLSPSV